MFPTQNTAYITRGLAQFTSGFTKDLAPHLRALATVYLTGVQEVENALFAVIEGKFLANATGVDLDIIGDLVGQPRTGLDDNTYRAAIRLRTKANRSNGLTRDITTLGHLIAAQLTGDLNGKALYREGGIMSFVVQVTDLLYPGVAQSLLAEAAPIGSRGGLVYSTWPAGADFSFSSIYASSVGEAGWGSVYSAGTGGQMLGELALG